MACDFDRFRQIAEQRYQPKTAASLCAIEQQLAAFERQVGQTKGDRAAFQYVIGDVTLHPFWFHAWQQVRRDVEAA